jgi:hypothetical protein
LTLQPVTPLDLQGTHSGVYSFADDRQAPSLFFPDIELSQYSRNAWAAGRFEILGGRIAVFFEKYPDIG